MTQKKLEFFVRKWQKTLGLQDWEIEIRHTHHSNLSGGRSADVQMNLDAREALVQIIEPGHYYHWNNKEQDVEKDIVHELIHIPLQAVEIYARRKEEKAIEIAVENAVNQIKMALIMLDRRGNEAPD